MRKLIALWIVLLLALPTALAAGPSWDTMTAISIGAGDFPGWGDAADLGATGALAADVVGADEIADLDWGPFTSSGGAFTIDNDAITDEHIDWTDVTLIDFTEQTADSVFYSDGSGDVQEVTLGADGTYLQSQGTGSAPIFSLPPGSGDITDVLGCTSGDCSGIEAGSSDYLNMQSALYSIPWAIETDCSAVVNDGRACWDSDGNVLYVGTGIAALSVSSPFGDAVDETEMDIVDFGSFTCTGGDAGCLLDNDSVGEDEIDWSEVTLADFAHGNNKVFYSDSSGVWTEVPLGTSGSFLKSNGSTSAPSFATPGGGGDVTGAGDCADGACLDGTSDGGTYVRLYGALANGRYSTIIAGDNATYATLTLPITTGTLVSSGDWSDATALTTAGAINTSYITGLMIDTTNFQLNDFLGEPVHSTFYSDDQGDVQYVTHGSAGQVLTSAGATDAPYWAAGGGDVTGVGDCADGACLDGSSDGGEYIRLYDSNSNYTALLASDTATNLSVYLPSASGTLVTDALMPPADAFYLVYSYDSDLDEEMVVTCTEGIECLGADAGGGDANSFAITLESTATFGFFQDLGAGSLTCGADNQGRVGVLDSGAFAYCDGAATSVEQVGFLDADGVDADSGGDVTDVFGCATGDCSSIALADGDFLDMSSVSVTGASEGLYLPVHATDCSSSTAEGQICWEEDDDTLYIGDSAAAVALGFRDISELDGGLSDDTYTGIVITEVNCGESITQWDLVYMDDTQNEWMIADADAAGEFPALGMATAACTDGNPGVVLIQGTVRNDGWAATITADGAVLYLGDTAGAITETAPSTSTDCVQAVGRVLSDTNNTILFNVDNTWVILD